jgi:hypothetical protein
MHEQMMSVQAYYQIFPGKFGTHPRKGDTTEIRKFNLNLGDFKSLPNITYVGRAPKEIQDKFPKWSKYALDPLSEPDVDEALADRGK